jgi:hypothetical protein
MARRPKPSARPAIALNVESTSPYGCILRFTTKIPYTHTHGMEWNEME